MRLLGTLVAAVLISAPGVAAQTGTVTGQVIDAQTGDSIAGVVVYIASLRMGSRTNVHGRYLVLNVPAGTYPLTVAVVGYRTIQAQITVGGDQTIERNFAISEEAPVGRYRLSSNGGGPTLPVPLRRRP